MEYIKSNHLDNTAFNRFMPEAKKEAIFNTLNTFIFIGGLIIITLFVMQEKNTKKED